VIIYSTCKDWLAGFMSCLAQDVKCRLAEAEQVLVLSHFKGHDIAGLALGFGSTEYDLVIV